MDVSRSKACAKIDIRVAGFFGVLSLLLYYVLSFPSKSTILFGKGLARSSAHDNFKG